jgi:hypothetical protein
MKINQTKGEKLPDENNNGAYDGADDRFFHFERFWLN